MSLIQILVIVSFAATLAYVSYTDFIRLEISNKASLFISVLFLPSAVMADIPFAAIGMHYLYGVAFLVAGAALFAFGLIGGGDVKLLAAVAIWFELTDLGQLVILVVLLGGGLALLMLVAQKKPGLARLLGSPPWLDIKEGRKQPIPYGIAISLATIIMMEHLPILPQSLQNLFNS